MSRTISQAERVEGERQHRLGEQISVVDRLYRLQPSDLGGASAPPRTAIVRQVSAQGIEQPQPMLHLKGLTKPLLLDAANAAALTRITASPLQRDWVGCEVALGVLPADNSPSAPLVIRLFAPDDPYLDLLRRKSQTAARARATAALLRQLGRYALLLLVVLLLAAAALYVYQNWAMLLELGTTLVEGLLNP